MVAGMLLQQSPFEGFFVVDHWAFVGRLVLAAACGAVVGWQRERHEKAAGLRTHILVSLAACLFTLVALAVDAANFTRVLQGIVTGAGFLGGGVIFREGASVRGLTTAAGLWVMTAVGMAAGTGEYFIGIVATVLTFLVLSALIWVEKHMERHADPPFSDNAPADSKRSGGL
jgi:putative Mg2+ transporter-C (MgtC) family protein